MRASRTRPIPSGMALSLLLKLSQLPQYRRADQGKSEQGLTLIECLVAIIIVTLTILAITPPILLATGTRVQSRRAEQANHIAQSEVDRIRLMVERGSFTIANLPAAATGATVNANIASAAAATTASNLLLSPSRCTTGTAYPGAAAVAWNSAVLVDVDGDCTPEYVMQVFRNTGWWGTNPSTDSSGNPLPPSSFDVGVRVYTYYPGQTFPTLQTTRASLIAGTNARDAQAGNARRPLAVLYSRMSRNDQSKSLGSICQQTASSTGTNPNVCNF
jgi:type II secretory pathway pseudopilin PulG